jgi:hypothetical protein
MDHGRLYPAMTNLWVSATSRVLNVTEDFGPNVWLFYSGSTKLACPSQLADIFEELFIIQVNMGLLC